MNWRFSVATFDFRCVKSWEISLGVSWETPWEDQELNGRKEMFEGSPLPSVGIIPLGTLVVEQKLYRESCFTC